MIDDDFDIDLELDSEPEPPKRRKRRTDAEATRKKGSPDSRQPVEKPRRDEAKPSEGEKAQDSGAATVVPPGKQGLISRILAPIAGLIGSIRLPTFNLRSFLVGLAILILLIAVVENWPATRLSFIGLHADIPTSVVIAVAFVVGFVAAWLVLQRRQQVSAE